MAIDYRANYTGQDLTTQNQGYDYISRKDYLQNPNSKLNVATFNISPNNSGIMGQYPQYPQYPIIPEGGDGGPGGPTGPGGNSKFDYEFEALGGLNNPNNVALTEEEQKTLNMQKGIDGLKKAGQFGLFALNPFGTLARKGFSKAIRNFEYNRAEKQRMKEFQQQKEARNRVDEIMSSQQNQQNFYDSLNDGQGSTAGGVGNTAAEAAESRSTAGDDPSYSGNTTFQYGGRAGYNSGGVTNYKNYLEKKGYKDMMQNMNDDQIRSLYDSVMGTFSLRRAYGGIVGMYR